MTIHWQSFSDFIAMGGYAGYVWGAIGVTVLLMVAEVWLLGRRKNKLFARLRRRMMQEDSQ